MKIWCQWGDLDLPSRYEVISRSIEELKSSELNEIDIYIPKYMGGAAALSPISQMSNLKIVQLLMAGYEDAIPYLRPGIRLFNARGVHDFSTAELTIALLLNHYTGVKKYLRNMDDALWQAGQRDSIYGKRIAVVGAGSVGKKIGDFLTAFDVALTFFAQTSRAGVRGISELPNLISEFDAVIVIVPLTNSTRHLVNADLLGRMRDGALLVNVARGPVVDTEALLVELRTGRISAALDVTDPEPLPSESELWRMPNVTITPHVGGNSSAFEPQARAFLKAQFTALDKGSAMANEIDWKV
jgi:phosphoglycerate dehydrogenase-like enzyme